MLNTDDLQENIIKHVKERKETQKIINSLGNPVLTTQYGLLYQTDCMNLFAALKGESVDCIFADPPFNLGKDYGNGENNDALATEDYLK